MRNQLLFRKQLIKLQILISSLNNSTNITNVTNPTSKKGTLTTIIKKAYNISNNMTKKELMAISTSNESDNNNKNIDVDKLEVEHAKEQE